MEMKKNGTMVTVSQYCDHCENPFTWRSQPFVLGRYPAGNMLLSFAVLLAWSSISKVRGAVRLLYTDILQAPKEVYLSCNLTLLGNIQIFSNHTTQENKRCGLEWGCPF